MSYLFDMQEFDEDDPFDTLAKKRSRSTRKTTKPKKLTKKQARRERIDKAFTYAMQESKKLQVGDWVVNKLGVLCQIMSSEEQPNGFIQIWGREYGNKTWLPMYGGSLTVTAPPENEIMEDDSHLLSYVVDETIVETVLTTLEETKYHEQEFESNDDDSLELDKAMNFNRQDQEEG